MQNWRYYSIHDDPCKRQQEVAKSLGVAQSTISMCLKALGMIKKQGSWSLYELNPRDLERCFFMCEQLLQQQKRR